MATNFVTDLIPLLPLQLISLPNDRTSLFYLLKLMRLYKGLKLLDAHALMRRIKHIHATRLQRKLDRNPQLGEDRDNDNIQVEQLLIIKYSLKISQMVLIILIISY